MIALDVSKSMLADDLIKGYSRLEVAKKGISSLFQNLNGDHIGIVVFAGDAYKQLPITPDYKVANMFLSNIPIFFIFFLLSNIAKPFTKST